MARAKCLYLVRAGAVLKSLGEWPQAYAPNYFFFLLINLFWLLWVFIAVRGLSLVAASWATLRCCAQASHCGGFSCCRARALGVWASVIVAHGL